MQQSSRQKSWSKIIYTLYSVGPEGSQVGYIGMSKQWGLVYVCVFGKNTAGSGILLFLMMVQKKRNSGDDYKFKVQDFFILMYNRGGQTF